MRRVKSIIFNRFSIKTAFLEKAQFLADNLSRHLYSDEVGFGFNEVTIDTNTLSANLLKRTPTFIQDYNEQSNELVKKQIFLFVSIHFRINLDQNIIIVEGGITQMNVLKSAFRNIFDFEYQIEPINLSAHIFLEKLAKLQIRSSIQQITIKGFNYNNGIVGRFAGEITKQEIGKEIVDLYKSDIVKISFNIKTDMDELLILQVYPNGNIKFVSDNDEYLFFLDYIKTIIFS